MSRYTIADQVVAARNVTTYGRTRPAGSGFDDYVKGIGAWITNAERVWANEPAAWYYQETGAVDWRIGSPTYGPLRPPFPTMWIEWTAPPRYFAEGTWVDTAIGGTGVLVTDRPADEVLDELCSSPTSSADTERTIQRQLMFATRVVTLTSFIRGREPNAVVAYGGTSLHGISDDGKWKGTVNLADDDLFGGLANAARIALLETARPAALAIGLMNCRNVKLTDPAKPVLSRAQRKRKDVPSLAFRTIKLPVSASASRSDKAGLTGDVLPLHTVRGHFKTFTAERPLMGKAIGTYWWGWQTRGKKSNGIVKKDYEVSA